MHTHKCGFSLPLTDFMRGGSVSPMRGCGFEWSHEELIDKPDITDSQLKEAHTCPSCHAGPWVWQVTHDTRQQHSFECAVLGIEECK